MQIANLKNFIQQISKEKDLDPDVISEAIQQALITASRKNLSMYHDAMPHIDLEKGQLSLTVMQTVVRIVRNKRLEIGLREARKIKKDIELGEELRVEIDPKVLGRIAAESAKQVVIQRLRDAERDKVFDEFEGRVGAIVTGVVQRFERGDAVINIGKAEALLPRSEIPRGVRYNFGDRLKCLVLSVEKAQKGPQIRLSRAAPELIIKLFEQEVPEVADGTVKIVKIARHAGVRTKIAVSSMNPDVDPVGACVGMKGSRVQMIVHEFENEKIDIIPYSKNMAQFISDALKPAKIVSMDLNNADERASIIVPEENLALAIGQKGQNVQLASQLVGWKIDIRGDAQLRAQKASTEIQQRYLEDFLNQITDLSDEQRSSFYNSSDYNSVEKIANSANIEIDALIGGNPELAETIVDAARDYYEALEEMQREAETDEDETPENAEEPLETDATASEPSEHGEADPEPEAEESEESEPAEVEADDDSAAAPEIAEGEEEEVDLSEQDTIFDSEEDA
ncbi:transcription termination/antitermination protein NusA [Candidatus Sumerlaeota bacterium]|nr:transcription termination/antitermination protein NusA [Candidatus Sumerlaeota bacterium]